MIRYKSIYISLLFLFSIFLIMVFKNIQYPLLWNDEADTAIFAQRVLLFGYPKVHDGKNVSNHFVSGNPSIAVKKETDAYIGSGWAQFYFAAPLVRLAERFEDIYLKTAMLRVPFTLAGFMGVLILAASVLPVFGNKTKTKLLFFTFFVFFELTSVYLILHLKQVRSHPLTLLLSSILIFLFVKHNFFNKINEKVYIILEIILLFLLFNTFYPTYFVFLGTLFIYEGNKFIKNLNKNPFTKVSLRQVLNSNVSICILSLFFSLPLVAYFEIPQISSEVSKHFSFSLYSYFYNLFTIVRFFLSFELLLAVGFLKCAILLSRKNLVSIKLNNLSKLIDISIFFSIFFAIYILVISLNPNFYFRYVVTLQPVLVIIFLLDLFVVAQFSGSKSRKFRFRRLLLLLTPVVFAMASVPVKLPLIKEYSYEVFHQYKGPLDYIIPYILLKYDKPQELVIATNYEEQSFMYYLESKVIIGHIGNNLEEDMKEDPDIIIPRRLMTGKSPIYELIDRGGYTKNSFEIFDYPVNNIPEIALFPKHLFRTKFATGQEDKLEIYEK